MVEAIKRDKRVYLQDNDKNHSVLKYDDDFLTKMNSVAGVLEGLYQENLPYDCKYLIPLLETYLFSQLGIAIKRKRLWRK